MSRSPQLVASNWQDLESRWDWSAIFGLTGLLVFMPLSFGAVEAWSELVVVLGAAGLSVYLALRVLLDRGFRLAKTWLYLPLGLILGLIALQLVPLPTSWLSAVAPRNVEVREELLGDQAPSATGESVTLSLSSYETAHDLRMALVFATLFVTTASVFRSSRQIKRALTAVFVVGCAEAGVSLLQILTLSTKIHWMFAERGRVVTTGSFINHSHFCQFVNLTLGAGIALLLLKMKEDSRQDRFLSGQNLGNGWERFARLLAGLVLCVVAVLISMSRNGAISLFVASAVMGVLLYFRGKLSARGWLLGMVPWCVLGVLFLTCFDTVYDRLATLEDQIHMDVRYEMTAGTLRAWQDFPIWGSGLGTHQYVFPSYDTAILSSVAEHADNDWAQLLEEFGVVGAAAVLAFVVSIFWVACKLMFRGRTTLSAAAFGLSVGLIATAIHSLSDFGQHLPAVFSMTAVVSGLLVAIARYENRKASRPSGDAAEVEVRARWFRAGGLAALVGLGWVWWWAGSGALAAYRGETWANTAIAFENRLQRDQRQASDQEYVDLLTAAQHAAEAEPKNVRHGYLLNLYRWQSISRTYDPETGQLLLHPDVLPFVAQIADELASVRSLCPPYGPPYGLEGELRLLVLRQPAGAELIHLAAKLAPYHAPTCLVAGQLAVEQGRFDEAVLLLNRTVQLRPTHFGTVAKLYLGKMQRPDYAEALAGKNYGRLSQLARLLDSTDPPNAEYAALAEKLRGAALVRLRERVETGEATAGELAKLANIEILDENLQTGIRLYRRALGLKYNQVHWRLALAHTLVAVGETDQAMREARICLRLHPESKAAITLIEDLSILPVKTPAK